MSADDLHRVAASLDAEQICDEVDWWRATIAIDNLLRRTRCTRRAARAATDAAHAVQEAAGRAGFVLPDAEVTRVARAAAEVGAGAGRGVAGAAGRRAAPRALGRAQDDRLSPRREQARS
jgi:hypothetical protein